MGKPTICICENKGADQRLCFRYTDSTRSRESGHFEWRKKGDTIWTKKIFIAYLLLVSC